MAPSWSFQLLAPNASHLTGRFNNATTDWDKHQQLLSAVQRVRGQCYLKDGAIKTSDLDDEGRFVMDRDERSWHLLLMDDQGDPIGCVRYLLHDRQVDYDDLAICHSTIARDPKWALKVKVAVQRDLQMARNNFLHYVEVGGWALIEQWRNSRAAFEMLVGSFALGSLWGGCLGCCTATVRHSSSSMLRRLGGESFTVDGAPIPQYEDAAYDCEMEILRFDYRHPSPRFGPLIKPLTSKLAKSPVLTASGSSVQVDTSNQMTKQLANLHASLFLTAPPLSPAEHLASFSFNR